MLEVNASGIVVETPVWVGISICGFSASLLAKQLNWSVGWPGVVTESPPGRPNISVDLVEQ